MFLCDLLSAKCTYQNVYQLEKKRFIRNCGFYQKKEKNIFCNICQRDFPTVLPQIVCFRGTKERRYTASLSY